MQLAVERLQDHGGVAVQHATNVKKLENQIEDLYRKTVAELFSNTETVPELIEMLKMREVVRHISNAADQGVIFADTVMDINIKVFETTICEWRKCACFSKMNHIIAWIYSSGK